MRAVSRLTLVVRCTEIGYSVSTQVLGFRLGCGWCCVVGFLFGCCWFCVLLLCVSAWWNRGILDEVTKASYGRAVTGTAVMARSANEEKKKKTPRQHVKASKRICESAPLSLNFLASSPRAPPNEDATNSETSLRRLRFFAYVKMFISNVKLSPRYRFKPEAIATDIVHRRKADLCNEAIDTTMRDAL